MKTSTITFLLTILSFGLFAQGEMPPYQTFRSYRLVNGHTAETLWKGQLFLNISHRFTGPLTEGFDNFFGFDNYADIRFSFGYGISDNFSVEVGRTRTGKQYDLQAKYMILRQNTNNAPLTLTVLGSAAAISDDLPEDPDGNLGFEHRMRYLTQVFVARRFHERFAGQLTGAWVHRNLTYAIGEENDTYLLGAGARVKITNLFHLSAEYYQPLNNETRDVEELRPIVGFGFDFITPRHAFQLTLSNSQLLLDQDFMTQTTRKFFDHRGLMLGFHITRTFF
jgi:hypothetical protein